MDALLHIVGDAAILVTAAVAHWVAMAVRILLTRSGE